MRTRSFTTALFAVVIAVMASVLTPFAAVTTAEAATEGFNPGNIIADSVFYDSGRMDSGSIQRFLESKVPNCRSGYTCLKDYWQNTPTVGASAYCSQFTGGYYRASEIIKRVADACSINPQALVVTLQKEQGIVTDTWPTARQYEKAMGYGCPDTADCDARYNGFFNQVYQAARRFQVYKAEPGDYNHRPFAWNDVRYNPNAGCGSSRVYIENFATAGLYNYTPYQPNEAALAAGYGAGDGCSAYGNRNFYNYFNAWFGSTLGSDLVRTASNPDVYLVTPSGKFRVPSMEMVGLLSPLGDVQQVAQGFLDDYSSRGTASLLMRDSATGDIFFIGDGRRYHLSSCDQIARFGENCSVTTSLSGAQLARFGDGGEVNDFVRATGTSTIYYLQGTTRRPINDIGSYQSLQKVAGQSGHSAIAASIVSRFTTGPAMIGPAMLTKSSSSPDIWFIDGFQAKRRLTSFDLAADIGAGSGFTTVPQGVLDSYRTTDPLDRNMVSCGPDYFVGAGGGLWSAGVTSGYGAGNITLANETCRALPAKSGRTGSTLYFTIGSDSTAYAVIDGRKRPIQDWAAFQYLSDGGDATIVTGMSTTSASRWSTGAPVLAPGTLVKASGDPKVYLVDGSASLKYVTSFSVMSDMGFAGSLLTVPKLDGYSETDSIPSPVLECGGDDYVGDRGALVPTTALGDAGLTGSAVADATCGSRVDDSRPTGAKLFVRSGSDSTVYYIQNGARRAVTSWSSLVALSGSSSPRVLVWSDTSVSMIPAGPSM